MTSDAKKALEKKIKELEGLTDQERYDLLSLLRKQKKYGLVWEEKEEDIEEKLREELPVLIERNDEKVHPIISDNPDAPNHLIIEGDNLAALTELSYTHAGKIDVIYIDPPYNTGNKDFIYNDSYVDKEDSFRHSKWLSFISKRLKIAKSLLSDRGVIFISIDDNEQANLKILCDEIFGEQNLISQFIWQKKTGSSDANNVAIITDYVLCYALNKSYVEFNGNLESFDPDRYKYKDKYYDERGPFYYDNLDRGTLGYHESLDYCIETEIGKTFPNGRNEKHNDGWRWKWSKEKVKWGLSNGFIEIKPNKNKKNGFGAYYKIYLNVDNEGNKIKRSSPHKNIINDVLNTHGVNELKDIFGKGGIFSNPKPLGLILFLIKLSTRPKTILDFFAGSGTTLHAVMQLNKEDGGHRQCILCTNNENNICEDVTYERNKRVIEGYTKPNGEFVDGLKNNNLRYYRTEFLPRERSAKNMRKLVYASTGLLCIKNDIYTESDFAGKKLNPKYAKYFNDSKKKMLVVYEERAIPFLVNIIKEMPEDTKIKVYVFSHGSYTFNDEFEEVSDKVELCALPQAIYDAYQKVLPKRKPQFLEEEIVENITTEEEINIAPSLDLEFDEEGGEA